MLASYLAALLRALAGIASYHLNTNKKQSMPARHHLGTARLHLGIARAHLNAARPLAMTAR